MISYWKKFFIAFYANTWYYSAVDTFTANWPTASSWVHTWVHRMCTSISNWCLDGSFCSYSFYNFFLMLFIFCSERRKISKKIVFVVLFICHFRRFTYLIWWPWRYRLLDSTLKVLAIVYSFSVWYGIFSVIKINR